MKRLAVLILLAALLTLSGAAQPFPPAEAAGPAAACQPGNVWGLCFDTLPKLWCCSPAFLGWSEIVVGDTFPVSGRIAGRTPVPMVPGESVRAVIIRFPSGKDVALPVGSDESFHGPVSFDEEGNYKVLLSLGEREELVAGFQVAYRAELVDLPTVDSQFGHQHDRTGVTLAAVEAGGETPLRVRFTDAKGEPVRSRSLAIGFGQQVWATDAHGVATILYRPDESERSTGYTIRRLYPGLGMISYREVRIEGEGRVSGLPGGEVRGLFREGRWYLPLREFLQKAAPVRLGDMPDRIQWDDATRTIGVEGFQIMTDTGMVLGRADFRSGLFVADGRTYMDLHSLIRFLDRLGFAVRTGEFAFRLSLAQEP